MDELSELMTMMEGKDTAEGYKALQRLERISDETGALYPYTGRFLNMVSDPRYAVRVRGFRLFCRQARWDKEGRVDRGLPAALDILGDEKPTAVRQALAALRELAPYKPQLWPELRRAASALDFMQYKDSMQGLILKDIRALLEVMDDGDK